MFLVASMIALLGAGIIAQPATTRASDLGESLSGRILIAVESNGEAWYVNPLNEEKYFLGSPLEAFNLMQNVALGITNQDFNAFVGKVPARLSGEILLKVEDSGRAYYVNPVNMKLYYLGRPADAFKVMRELGLGITNANLATISSFATGIIPSIELDYQSSKYDHVTIREVNARANGWIVIHQVANGEPGEIVGQTSVRVGKNSNISVRLNGIRSSQDLIAMLYYDLGQTGLFEYPGPDVPVMLDGQNVMKKFFATYTASTNKNVQIIGSSFNPKNLTVTKGATVTWTNNESVIHTISSSEDLNSGNILPGKSYSRVFNDAGTYNYHCSLHPNMIGSIIVQ